MTTTVNRHPNRNAQTDMDQLIALEGSASAQSYRKMVSAINDVVQTLLQRLLEVFLHGLIIIFSTVIPVSCSVVVNIIFWCFDCMMHISKTVDNNHLQCSHCYNRLKDPKILPCLHLCCRDCVATLVRKHRASNKLPCPQCTRKHKIPQNGADGFRTDFEAKGRLHLMQIKEGYRNNETHECIWCSNTLEIIGYCFSCDGYLCKDCHRYHLVDDTLTDHRQRTVAMEGVELTNMPLDQLASLMDIPMCSDHTDKTTEFFCKRCDNLPVCQLCVTRGQHKKHALIDPCRLAEIRKSNINKTLAECQKHEDNVETITKYVNKKKTQLANNVQKAFDDIEEQEEAEKYRTSSELIRSRNALEERIAQISVLEREHIDEAKKRMEGKIENIRKTCENEMETIRLDSAKEMRTAKEELEKNEESLADKVNSVRQASAIKKAAIQQVNEEKLDEIQNIASLAEDRMKQLQSLKEYASRVLSSNNVWTLAQHSASLQGTVQTLLDNLQNGSTHILTYLSELDIDIDVSSVSTDEEPVPSAESSVNEAEDMFSKLNDGTKELESISHPKSQGECSMQDGKHKSLFNANVRSSDSDWEKNDIARSGNERKVGRSRLHPTSQDECSLNGERQKKESTVCNSEASVSDVESISSNVETVALSECDESLLKINAIDNVGEREVRSIAPTGIGNEVLESASYPTLQGECRLKNETQNTKETLATYSALASVSDVESISSNIETIASSECEESLLKVNVIADSGSDWKENDTAPIRIEANVFDSRSYPKSQGECRLEDERYETNESQEIYSEASVSGVESISSNFETITLGECEESTFKVNVPDSASDWEVQGIAPAGKESFVIVGRESADASAVTVVNIATTLSRTYTIPRSVGSGYPGSTRKLVRLCALITDSKIVTISSYDDIGILDIDLGTWSVSQRSIRDLVGNWPKNRFVYCITADEKTRQVIVGAERHRRLAVLDYQLNYVNTVSLPTPIKGSGDVATHGSNLLVCDCRGKRAYAVSIEGNHSELIYEFTKPGFDVIKWKPARVTTDKNDFVYMLWNDNQSSDRYRCIVVQYSQDGQQLLEIREFDGNSGCLTVLDSMRGEKLLIATLKSRKVYFYDLVRENCTEVLNSPEVM